MTEARSRSPLPILFSVVVVDLIGFGIAVPVLPFYADHYGASGTTLGALVAVYAAMQFVFAPRWGRLSDRIGRRPVLVGTITGSAVALVALGLSQSLAGLFAARIAGGLFAANIGVASAYIADVTSDEERTRWLGVLGACFGVGFTVGPVIGGLLAPLGLGVPFLVAGGLAAVNAVLALVRLPEPERHRGGERSRGLRQALALPGVGRLWSMNLAFALASAQLETMFAYLMKDRFDYGPLQVGWLLGGVAVVMGAVQGGGIKSLVARFGERRLAIAGAALCALGFAAIPVAPSVAWLLLPLTVSAVGRGMSQPSMQGWVSRIAPAAEQGAVLGAYVAAGSLARVVGPSVAGPLYDLWWPAPFLLAGLLTATVATLAARSPAPAHGPVPAAPLVDQA